MNGSWTCARCGREVPVGRECPAHLNWWGWATGAAGVLLLILFARAVSAQEQPKASKDTKAEQCTSNATYVDTTDASIYKCRDGRWMSDLSDKERFDLMSLRDDAHAADAALAHAMAVCGSAALKEIQEDQQKQQAAVRAFQVANEAAAKKAGCALDDKFKCPPDPK